MYARTEQTGPAGCPAALLRRLAAATPATAGRVIRTALVAALCAWVLVSAPGASARAAGEPVASRNAVAGAAATLRVGTQRLSRCALDPLAYCGRLSVPLDYGVPSGPRISVAYRFYPASAPPAGTALGTVVPVEGGPGYPSIGSVEGGYSVMYGSLLERFNMLAVDNRGTGQSTPLKCPALQEFSGPTGTSSFQEVVGACATALNHRWRYADGSWVHASDLFTSAPAAEDLAAVITALDLPRVDLYGDSYGSFFAQVFASRFPQLLRSVILDPTYQRAGLDPWYRSTLEAMPADLDAVCSRSPACAQAAPGSSWARIGTLAESLRRNPISEVVPGPDGALEQVGMGVVGLVDLLNDAAGDPEIYRALDASARALLNEDDPAPLLRLYAQRLAEDEAYFGVPVRQYSDELYLAVSCLDYPQLFDMSAPEDVRAGELQAAEAALPDSTFSPFSTDEWLAQDQNTEAYTACLRWPSPTVAQPPTTGSQPLLPSSLPVLVLGGELDTWTPPSGVPAVLAQIGGHARFIELANATHVVGEGDTACASTLVQEFVADPAAIDSLQAACASAVPPIRAVGSYPERLEEEPPLQTAGADGASPAALRLGAAAVSTAGDALARYQAIEASPDAGLHGGSVTAARGGAELRLHEDRLLPDVAVSGTVTLTPNEPIEAGGDSVTAVLSASAPGLRAASLTATWSTAAPDAEAVVLGTVEGEAVAGSMPAP